MAATRGFPLARALRVHRSLFSEAVPSTCRADIETTATPKMCHCHSFVSRRYCGRNEAVRLAYTRYEPPDMVESSPPPPIIMLDGLFGCWRNWDAVSPAIARVTGRNVFAVDLRNHGDSPHRDDIDYHLMCADLELFLRDWGFSRASLVGHSMGGRIAMKFATTRPGAVERLVVVDMAPIYLPAALTAQWLPWQMYAMETILRLFSPHMSLGQARQVADQFLSSKVTKPYVREFLLTNLRKGPCTIEWQLNLKAIKQNYLELAALDYLHNESSDVEALFVRAEDSIYITSEDHDAIKQWFPNGRIVTVKGAGHWVHNDKPEEFVALLRDFLSASPSGRTQEKELRFVESKKSHAP